MVPLTAMPLIVPGSAIFEAFLVSVYSIIGWTIGAAVAFLIARHLGKPFLATFFSLERLEKYEQYLSGRVEFWMLVLMRMILPVDILSYAVGILSRISFKKYILATIVGITPFAFVFAYISDAFVQGKYTAFTMYIVGGVLLFGLLYLIYRIYRVESKVGQKRDNENEDFK